MSQWGLSDAEMFGRTNVRGVMIDTLRHVYEELQKYQRTTQEPGLIFYILKKEAGL